MKDYKWLTIKVLTIYIKWNKIRMSMKNAIEELLEI